jgi:hypothetical protein
LSRSPEHVLIRANVGDRRATVPERWRGPLGPRVDERLSGRLWGDDGRDKADPTLTKRQTGLTAAVEPRYK